MSGTGHDRVDVDVLVIGAGPTGLTAASEAIRHGLRVRVIDRKSSRSTFSKALVVHARTLEVFETMGIADRVLAQGVPFAALNAHAGRRRRTVRIDLLSQPWGDTAYPFWLSLPQYVTEQILEEHLGRLGGRVEWQVSLDELHDREDHVEARLVRADGSVEVVRSRWLLGCDGGRSRTREQAGLRLARRDAAATFVLADVKTTAALREDEGYVYLHPDGLLLIVPMPEPHRWRIIAHVARPLPEASIVDALFLEDLIRRRSGLEFGCHDVTWQSSFDLSHGVVDRYRQGRVFVAGDAAHVHSPVGGQGLNTGVQDTHNLLWKLASAQNLDAGAAEALLDSYEAERRPVAAAMVRGTARVTGALTRQSNATRVLVGLAAPRILRRRAVQARFGRQVGMLEVSYRRGSRKLGTSVAPGDRMPNPRLRTGGHLHQCLDPISHTWVIWGRPAEPAPDSHDPRWRGLPIVFLTDEALAEAVASVPAVVTLVRPDRIVAAAGESADAVWQQIQNRVPPEPRREASDS